MEQSLNHKLQNHYTTQKLYLKKKRSKNKARTAGVGIHWRQPSCRVDEWTSQESKCNL